MNAIKVWFGDLTEGEHEKLLNWTRLMVDEICRSWRKASWNTLRRRVMVDEKAWKGWS